jgi:hypothetical protein
MPRLESRVAQVEPPSDRLGSSPSPTTAVAPIADLPLQPSGTANTDTSASSLPTGTINPSPTRESAFQDAFTNAIQEITALLSEATIPMRRVYNVLLGAARTGLVSNDCVILVRPVQGRPFCCDYGCGLIYNTNQGASLVREGERNVFGLGLTRLEDIYINDATAPSIVPHLPDWLRAVKLNSMIILPLHESRVAFALMVVAWPEKKAVKFTDAELRQVRALLRLIGTAHRISRS